MVMFSSINKFFPTLCLSLGFLTILTIFGIPKRHLNIANLEMFNIFIALRVLADQWAHKRYLFKCDNLAVVQLIQPSKTTNEFSACGLTNIWRISPIHDIKLEMEHIRGINNRVVDALSSLHSDESVTDDFRCDFDTKYKFYQVLPA